jgi:hypothetical protein
MSALPRKDVAFHKPAGKAEIDRRRRMAQALTDQGKQPQSTEVIGGYAVKQSPTAALAKALTAGLGGYQEGQAAQMEQSNTDARQKLLAEAVAKMGTDPKGGAAMLLQNEDTSNMGMDLYADILGGERSIDLARQRAQIDAQYRAPTQAPAPLQVANAYLEALQSGDTVRANAIREFAKTQEKGTFTTPSGEIAPLPGIENTLSALEEAKQTGQNISDLQYKPDIAGAEEAAKLEQQLVMEPKIAATTESTKAEANQARSDAQAMPILEDMLTNNAQTFDTPYLQTLQGPAKLAGNKQQTTAFDLMKQNRLNLAAPLAKALGVNPTDKDFQATLERIVDMGATKTSREAQIRNLMAQIDRRNKGKIGPQGQGSNPAISEPDYSKIKPAIVNWEDLP